MRDIPWKCHSCPSTLGSCCFCPAQPPGSLGRARIWFHASAEGSARSFMLPAQTCPQSWHTPAGGRDPQRSHLGDTTLLSVCQGMALDTHSQIHSGSPLAPSTPADPRRSHGSPGSCTMVGTLSSASCLAPSLAQRQVRKVLPGQLWLKGENKQAGKVRAEITARAVTSSGAAAPSLGGHCHPGAHLPPFSMARDAQHSLAEHLQLPRGNSLPWSIQGPQGSTKPFLK